jgi:hypothetical protein
MFIFDILRPEAPGFLSSLTPVFLLTFGSLLVGGHLILPEARGRDLT